MKDFKRTPVACAAASTFGLGAYTIYSGVDQISSSKVKATVDAYYSNLNAQESAAVSGAPAVKK
jgi:hypothetical protein